MSVSQMGARLARVSIYSTRIEARPSQFFPCKHVPCTNSLLRTTWITVERAHGEPAVILVRIRVPHDLASRKEGGMICAWCARSATS